MQCDAAVRVAGNVDDVRCAPEVEKVAVGQLGDPRRTRALTPGQVPYGLRMEGALPDLEHRWRAGDLTAYDGCVQVVDRHLGAGRLRQFADAPPHGPRGNG